MKPAKTALSCLVLLVGTLSFAQEKKDNYSFFKMYASNDKGEILMVKWQGEWEVFGSRYDDSLTISAFLNNMAASCGIKVKDKKLGGVFTQFFLGRRNPTVFHWYAMKYAGGTLKIPEDCEEIRWFSLKEAIKATPYPAAKLIMDRISGNPGKVFGGAYRVNYKEKPPGGTYTMLEDFHLLN